MRINKDNYEPNDYEKSVMRRIKILADQCFYFSIILLILFLIGFIFGLV